MKMRMIIMKKSHKQLIIGAVAAVGGLFTVNELMKRGIIPNPFLTKGRQTEVTKQTNLSFKRRFKWVKRSLD